MTIQGAKQNPELLKEDLRRMALTLNKMVARLNRGYSEYVSKSITSSSTADDTATLIYASSTGGAVNFTLQAAKLVPDRYYGLMKTDSSTNAVAFQSTDGINGSTASSTTTQYNITWVHSNGSVWRKI